MNPIAVALGLWFAPALGTSLVAAFDDLGPDAVFGPGCSGDGAALKTVQAPARWRGARVTPAIAALGSGALTVMAELQGDTVRATHVALQPRGHVDAAGCRAMLEKLPGGSIDRQTAGGVVTFTRSLGTIAQAPARYRALFRPAREECRLMLTIGG